MKKRNNKIHGKKAQVTIFIIIAIVLVIGIILYFLVLKPRIAKQIELENPETYIEKCLADSAKEAIDILDLQGGDINPQNYFMYKNEKARYLCYTPVYYSGCVNQEPLLKEHVEQEINNYVKPKLQQCIENLKNEYQRKQYIVDIQTEGIELKTSLKPKTIVLDAEFQLKVRKEDNVIERNQFQATLQEPLYELAILALEITKQEAQFGNFEQLGYMLLYHDIEIDKDRVDESIIYTLTDRTAERQFRFAVRGYVTPPSF